MVKANELRIGIYIFDDDGEVARVTGLRPYEHSIRCDEEEGCDISIDIHSADGQLRKGFLVASSSANPIPLTPEWLERCGFENRTTAIDEGIYEIGNLLISKIRGEFYPCVWGESGPDSIGKSLKYVHQLQNLYFALTGEELNVKL